MSYIVDLSKVTAVYILLDHEDHSIPDHLKYLIDNGVYIRDQANFLKKEILNDDKLQENALHIGQSIKTNPADIVFLFSESLTEKVITFTKFIDQYAAVSNVKIKLIGIKHHEESVDEFYRYLQHPVDGVINQVSKIDGFKPVDLNLVLVFGVDRIDSGFVDQLLVGADADVSALTNRVVIDVNTLNGLKNSEVLKRIKETGMFDHFNILDTYLINTEVFHIEQEQALEYLKGVFENFTVIGTTSMPSIIDDADALPTETLTETNIFNFWQAGMMLCSGIAMRRLAWGNKKFLTYDADKELEADKFWIYENREAALNNNGVLNVNPRFSYCDGKSVDMGWIPTPQDMFACDWVKHPSNLMLADAVYNEEIGVELYYSMYNLLTKAGGDVWFTAYDGIIDNPNITHIVILSLNGQEVSLIASILSDMREKLNSTLVNACTTIPVDAEIIKDGLTFGISYIEQDSLPNTMKNLSSHITPHTAIVIDVSSICLSLSHWENDQITNYLNDLGKMIMESFPGTPWVSLNYHEDFNINNL